MGLATWDMTSVRRAGTPLFGRTSPMAWQGDWHDTEYGRSTSGSCSFGGLLVIVHRWHDCCKHGMWLITLNWHSNGRSIGDNHDAVVDDFGDLVPVGRDSYPPLPR